MKLNKLIAILFAAVLVVSCNNAGGSKDSKDGDVATSKAPKDSITVSKQFWPNGNIRQAAEAINLNYGVEGKKPKWVHHGVKKEFQQNKKGVLLTQTSYNMGKKEGKSYKYYENGKVYMEWNYVAGKKEGLTKKFSREGRPVSEVPYKQDMLGIGTKEFSNSTGKPLTMPTLKVWTKDNRRANGSYTVYAKVVSKSGTALKATFFQGMLIEGKYYHKNLEAAKLKVGKDRVASITFYENSGIPSFVNVVAKHITSKGTPVLLAKPVNIR